MKRGKHEYIHETTRPRALLVSVLATAMLLLPAIAFAVNPNSTTIPSTGQSLDIEITSPADGATVPAGDPVTVEGLVGIGGLSVGANVMYVVDVSGSTGSPSGQDCDGDGTAGDADDDFNGDGTIGDTLDCEISGVVALNDSLSTLTGVDGGIVPFGSTAVVADVDPASGQQDFTTPLNVDKNTNGIPDLEEVMRSMDQGSVSLFTAASVGGGTNFNDALSSMNGAFAGQPAGENNIAFFLSDGEGFLSTGPGTPLQAAVDAGTIVNTYAVGGAVTGECDSGQQLRTIADSTGGTCTVVADPAGLAAALEGATPAGIDRVEVSIDGGTPMVASLDALGNFSATIPGSSITGPSHTIEATAFADDPDNTSVTADITINVQVEATAFDVYPNSCPNPFTLGRPGVVPAAILGSGTLEVADIDPSTVVLTGPEADTASPIRWSIEDVAGPDEFPEPESRDDCGTDGPDGFDDLTLKFDAGEFQAVLGDDLEVGDVVIVTITAETSDGTEISGTDIVWINASASAPPNPGSSSQPSTPGNTPAIVEDTSTPSGASSEGDTDASSESSSEEDTDASSESSLPEPATQASERASSADGGGPPAGKP